MSGKKLLQSVVPRIIGANHSFSIHSFSGIGHIPKGMGSPSAARQKMLLDKLPSLLQAYGTTFSSKNYQPPNTPPAVIIVCDLDDKDFRVFLGQLQGMLTRCNPRPNAFFCIAVEEEEAWLLGDIPAVKSAYPKATNAVLNNYCNDSICGTWETLADAIYPGGRRGLSKKGWPYVGTEKCSWAIRISSYMNVQTNKSVSFCFFRDRVRNLAP